MGFGANSKEYRTSAQVRTMRGAAMKDLFLGYYRRTDGEMAALWAEGTFVPDANVLLNLHRYSPKTTRELLRILGRVADRLWIPHQVAHEYHANRLSVIAQQAKAYDDVQATLDTMRNKLAEKLNALQRDAYRKQGKILLRVERLFKQIKSELVRQRAENPDLADDESIMNRITALLRDRVGTGYTRDRLRQIRKDGEERYARRIPPGFLDDDKKPEHDVYGDLIIWNEILEHAKATKRPVILITDDAKDDWWWRFGGKIRGPRPELVAEMQAEAGVMFHMYRADKFMEYARKHLKGAIDQQAIAEVREVRIEEENRRSQGAVLREAVAHTQGRARQIKDEMEWMKEQLEVLEDPASTLGRLPRLARAEVAEYYVRRGRSLGDEYRNLLAELQVLREQPEANETAEGMVGARTEKT
jgi:hypothetical protein